MAEKQSRVKMYLDEETDLHYIVGEQNVLFENGVIVDARLFKNRKPNGITTRELIEEALKDPAKSGYDFQKSMETLCLERKVQQVKKQQALPQPQVEAEKKPETVKKAASSTVAFFSAPHGDIIVMLSVVGAVCFFMSMYNSFTFLSEENGKDILISVLTSFAFCLFAASAFTAARHIFEDKKIDTVARWVYSPVLILFGIMMIVYLIVSTITVNYDQYMKKEVTRVEQFISTDTGMKAQDATLEAKEKEVKAAEDDVARYDADSSHWLTVSSKALPDLSSTDPAEQKKFDAQLAAAKKARDSASTAYAKSQKSLEVAIAKRDKLYGERSVLLSGTGEAADKAKATRKTAFSVMQDQTGIPSDKIAFFVYVAPAVFFDIISPFALSMVFLLRDRRKAEKEIKEASDGTVA